MITDEELLKLKEVTPLIHIATEGGYTYILIENLVLPDGCTPQTTNALLCPAPRDGYNSRLFFEEKITGPFPGRNWNGNIRVLGKNWHAVSWNVPENLDLVNQLFNHLRALRNV